MLIAFLGGDSDTGLPILNQTGGHCVFNIFILEPEQPTQLMKKKRRRRVKIMSTILIPIFYVLKFGACQELPVVFILTTGI